MSDIEQDIRRAERAKALLADELIQEGFAHIEAELWRKFQELQPSDDKSVLFVKHMQYIHAKYKAFFQQVIANGKIAQINLEVKKKSLRERVFG